MPDPAMHASDWANIARCAGARYKAAYWQAMETGEKAPHGVLWGPLHDLAWRELNTCLMARNMAFIRRQRSNA
jgi:hypothetical protein